jgi:tRNA pseudouridine55 synthase
VDSTANATTLDGVLVVDKPVGPTSHDVVARVRRACRGARVGHTGTLDPLASGVLPLVIGRATRLARFLSASDKTYEATVRLGIETDSYDAEGQETRRVWASGFSASVEAQEPDGSWGSGFSRIGESAVGATGPGEPAMPTASEIERALDRFRGEHEQVPPPFSAKKVGGTRAYELARQQRPVALAPVRVTVHAISLSGCDGDLVRLAVTCSAGFYVRVLAHELGRALGCGAHLAALRRTRSGPFGVDRAIPLDRLTGPDAVATALVPLDAMLPHLGAVRLTERGVTRTRHGQALEPGDIDGWLQRPPPASWSDPVRLFDLDGHLLAIAARREADAPLHPGIVLV